VFRKLESGPNPDVEIGEMFARTGADVPVPELIGTITIDEGESATVLAIVQQYVHNHGDGWGWLLDQLRHQVSGSVSAIGLLGQRTAEMHMALAGESNDAAFAPDPVTTEDLSALQSRIESELRQTIDGLRQAHAIDHATGESLQTGLQGKIASLDALNDTMKIRIHGDYHLGQVLRTVESDFRIIDFEGEPTRPMNERRKKWPALRDVAGMVRSLDYAVQTILREQPERTDLEHWRDEATTAFVAGYRTAIEPSLAIVPAEDADFDRALAVLTVEKALYETRYELGNRPDWLGIPLSALQRIAGD
jgi:trehalose synthase-fused probable maltokinase